MTNRIKTTGYRRYQLFLMGALVGVVCFLCIFGFRCLDVTYDAFLRGGFVEKDIQQHYAGWLFYRQSPLSFPLCIADGINYPQGLSIAYTDSIPLFAAFFRLIEPLLPETFQYFGLYSVLCYFLLGGFSSLLLSLFLDKLPTVLLGTLLLSCNPVLVERTLHHTSLGAQFFLVAAFYFYFLSKNENAFRYKTLFVLNALLLAVHPYFVPMCYAVTLALLAEYALRNRNWKGPLLYLLADLAATLAVGWCVGLFNNHGDGGSEALYGYFGLNLNALWNPTSVGDSVWSRLLPIQNQVGGNYDSFAYLGLGVLLFGSLSFVWQLFHLKRGRVRELLTRHWCLLLCCLALCAFAVSTTVTANGATLISLHLPARLQLLASTFRASGRMFWPIYYLMFLYAIVQTCRSAGRFGTIALVGLCLVQLWDISPALIARHQALTQYTSQFPSELVGDFWSKSADKYNRIISLDGPQQDALHLALFAADNSMFTDDPFAARYDTALLSSIRSDAIATLSEGKVQDKTLYLIQNEDLFLQLADDVCANAWCGQISEKWFIIAPGMMYYTGNDGVEYIGDKYPFRISTYSDDNWERGVLTWDNQTILFTDCALFRRRLENATGLRVDGYTYKILDYTDKDEGWLMVTLDIKDARALRGVDLTAVYE